jgi:hypothetical protein
MGSKLYRRAVAGALLALGWLPSLSRGFTFFEGFDTLEKMKQNWGISTWGGDNRVHSAENVRVADGILDLELSGSQPGQKPVCAEIVSKRSDFHYGTYRSSIKVTNKPGAVVGFFIYLGNPLNEIDIEFLTVDPRTAYFTLHHNTANVDHTTRPLAFDPSAAFHEYRFDWYRDSVVFFIDAKRQAVLKKQVPLHKSLFMLNHWSGNIAGWGGPAPREDVHMLVDWAYYSSDYTGPNLPSPVRRVSLRGVGEGSSRSARAALDDGALRFLRDGRAFSLSGRVLPPSGLVARPVP